MSLHIGIREQRPGCFRLRYWGGNARERYRTVHGTLADAERAAAAWRAELEQGEATLSQSTTLAACIRAELALSKHAPSTVAWYDRLLRLYIEPRAPDPKNKLDQRRWHLTFGPRCSSQFCVGRKQVGRIRLQDGMDFQTFLQEGFDAKFNAGIAKGKGGSKAISDAIRLCMRGLEYARQHGAIAVNPWARLRVVQYRDPWVKTLTTKRELATLQQIARKPRTEMEGKPVKDGARVGMLLKLAEATGARRGELLALRWLDVDLAEHRLQINASLDERNGECMRRPTKTRHSERSIVLPVTMVSELKTWRGTQLQHALRNGWINEFDFSPVLGDYLGNWWSPATASQAARRALHAAGLKVSLHSIRHSHGSMLLGKPGINPLAVASRLGHRNLKMLLRTYGHVMEGDDAAAAAAINQVMTAGKR